MVEINVSNRGAERQLLGLVRFQDTKNSVLTVTYDDGQRSILADDHDDPGGVDLSCGGSFVEAWLRQDTVWTCKK